MIILSPDNFPEPQVIQEYETFGHRGTSPNPFQFAASDATIAQLQLAPVVTDCNRSERRRPTSAWGSLADADFVDALQPSPCQAFPIPSQSVKVGFMLSDCFVSSIASGNPKQRRAHKAPQSM